MNLLRVEKHHILVDDSGILWPFGVHGGVRAQFLVIFQRGLALNLPIRVEIEIKLLLLLHHKITAAITACTSNVYVE